MDQTLVDRMRTYLDAGLAMDVEALDALYDPAFENVRCDEEGLTVTLTKDMFMNRFRALKAQGRNVGESVDDATFLATGAFGAYGWIVVHRVKDGLPVLYTFVWQRDPRGGWGTLLREFTYEKDISHLVRLMERAAP
ncbi:DUF4440 domain-containing protein [Streptomyces vietnamensis]|uniref:Uncharacterized protein n=1 Tax=Streptomyces vietnamensis TaxID=362257 RepID=A0A0B5IC52_9ACTN|nr:DUF4440 domain-containing protein [Streptomyces vietnamensis]AJF65919.1 hypothetical protein SVTN_17490 [Streptomyces vietnamensis]